MLDEFMVEQVSYIVAHPPEQDRYNTLKQALITAYADAERQRVKKLLTEIDLGDRKPSQLLREMKQLASDSVDEDFLKLLWTQRLPQQMQTVLAVCKEDLTHLAIFADRMLEVQPAFGGGIAALRISTPPPAESPRLVEAVEAHTKRIDMLEQRISCMGRRDLSASQRRRSPGRSPSRTFSGTVSNLCWYHELFGSRAEHCRPPCTYTDKGSAPSN